MSAKKNEKTNTEKAGKKSSTKKMESTGESSDQVSAEKPKTPNRNEASSLAVQLVSAQIIASSQASSTARIISATQKIAAEYLLASARLKSDLETLSSHPEMIDQGFVDRAYVHLQQSAMVAQDEEPLLKPLDDPTHDTLFEGALARVQDLLKSPSEDTKLIFAEQLFLPGEMMSEAKVGERFKSVGWPGLRNRGNFHSFMVQLQRWFHDYLVRRMSPEDDRNYDEDAEMMGYILKTGSRRNEDDLFRKIHDLVKNHELPNKPRTNWTSTEELHDVSWTKHLITTIFCGVEPSETRETAKQQTRYYYPWGLFRFLRFFGTAPPTGSDLLESIAAQRCQLEVESVIHPIHQKGSGMYSFGPLEELAEKSQDEEIESKIQG